MRRRQDVASTQTLEAMVIATVMVTAVAFVVTFQTPPAPTSGARGIVASNALDALNILGDEPISDSELGTNALSVALMECLQSNCTRLQEKMAVLLPAGSQYAVYVSNGHGVYPVYEPRAPPGEAISAGRLFEPQWSWSFLGPAVDTLNPADDPMVLYDLPIVNSRVATQDGHLLDIVVKGVRADNSSYVMRTSASTRAALASAAATTPAVSLYFVDGAGAPIASLDGRATTLSGATVTRAPLAVTLRVNESAGVSIPAGANVTLQVPRGWNASASPALNPGWTIVSQGADTNGSAIDADLVASLNASLANGTKDLKVNLTYGGDVDDHYVLRAAMARGAYAQAALLLTSDAHATTPGFEVPTVSVSAPRPMGATATTTWTLAAHVPGSSGSSDNVTITEVSITEDSGARIFGDAYGLTGGGAWNASSGSSLVWTGSATLSRFAPLNLTFRVNASGLAGSSAERAPFTPSVSLDGWRARIADPASPGLYRTALLPSDTSHAGYNGTIGVALESNHTAESASVYRATALPGNFTYATGYATGIRDAVFGSDIALGSRQVPLSSSASVEVNVQSLAYELAKLGMKPVITLKAYPPWAGNDRTPIWSETLYNAPALLGSSSLLSVLDGNGDGNPEPSSIGRYNVSLPVPSNWLFGTYVLDAEVAWNDTLSARIAGEDLTFPVVRAAHVYDYMVVTPPDSVSPASPVYDARLVVWFEDWR